MKKEQLQQMVDAYLEAEIKILKGQSVSMAGRTLTMADLESIRRGRKDFERRLATSGKTKHSLASLN